MNIVKLQNELKGVPDQTLIGYVQNPNGQVPSYLALSELNRRKEMRDNYQQQKAPQKSVAEDLEQESKPQGLAGLAGQPAPQAEPQAQPQAGVAALPTGDMFQEQNFASGGIIAFDEGGDVPLSAWDRFWKPLTDYGQRMGERENIRMEKQRLTPSIIGPGLKVWDPETESEYQSRLAKKAELDKKLDMESAPTKVAAPAAPANNKIVAPSDTVAKKTEQKEVDPYAQIAKLTKPVSIPVAAPKSLHDYAEEYKKEMGEDPDKAARLARIKKMEDRAAAQEARAPWMALMEAGLNIAGGTSPYALTNIGQGAQAGIKSYTAAQDKLAALEEKRMALMDEAAKADRAEKLAAIQFGKGSMEHQQTLDNQRAIQNSQNATTMAVAQLSRATAVDNKLVANRNAAIDNVLAKMKLLKPEGFDSQEDFDKTYNMLLEKEFATMGVKGTGSTGAAPQGVKVTKIS